MLGLSPYPTDSRPCTAVSSRRPSPRGGAATDTTTAAGFSRRVAASTRDLLNVEAAPGTIPTDYGWMDAATLAAYLHRDRHGSDPGRANLPTARAVEE